MSSFSLAFFPDLARCLACLFHLFHFCFMCSNISCCTKGLTAYVAPVQIVTAEALIFFNILGL